MTTRLGLKSAAVTALSAPRSLETATLAPCHPCSWQRLIESVNPTVWAVVDDATVRYVEPQLGDRLQRWRAASSRSVCRALRVTKLSVNRMQ